MVNNTKDNYNNLFIFISIVCILNFPIMKYFIWFKILLLATISTFAQVKTNFNNSNKIDALGCFNKKYKSTIDFNIQPKNIEELLKKEKELVSNEGKPFQFAVAEKIDLDLFELIDWIYDGDNCFGKYTLKLEGALSTSINFDSFYLPIATEMYIYNEYGNIITGAITEKENNSKKVWGSWVYKGQYLTIEIKIPTALKHNLKLHANNIAYGYKEIYKDKTTGFGTSGACNINVLCPLGNGWEGERNAVGILMSSNGTSFCSGSMIMNTCGSNKPFFLTANHCFAGDNVSLWRFGFQAWSATCTPSQNSNGLIFNGSTLKANWANSDFCLVELNNIPNINSNINYNGWNKSSIAATRAMGIHHPSGDVMKISEANNPVVRANYGSTLNTHWQTYWTQGVTEGGSSGSPLYDQNHRVIGQLHGGPSACGATQLWDFYGAFDLSWTGGGTSITSLSNWLDPGNTGAITTNTTNINSLSSEFISINAQPINVTTCSGTQASFNVSVLGNGLTYQWQVSTDAGISFNNISGAINTNYSLSNTAITMNGNQYRVIINSTCGSISSISNPATLSIISPVFITTQPVNISTCTSNATFSVSATATNYQWQVSNDGGVVFTNIVGANATSLVLNNVTPSMSSNKYRVLVSNGICTAVISNNVSVNVSASPTVTLDAAPYTAINPFHTTTITSTLSPSGNYTFEWKKNNIVIPTISSSIIGLNGKQDDFGTYQLTVTNTLTGCKNSSNKIIITDIESERNKLFISPNPSKNIVQISFYNNLPLQKGTINLFDSKGAKVYSNTFIYTGYYSCLMVDLSIFNSGVYLIGIYDSQGNKINSGKIVKE